MAPGRRLLCHGTSQAPQAVSIGLRNCYLARCSFRRPFAALTWDIPRPTRHELFLLGFETAIWHFRSATSCFYWASKLLSGTFSAPLKTFKGFQNPPSSFRRPFAALPLGFETAIWQPRGATSCFYRASKLLSGTFSAPLKPSKALKPSQQLSTAFRCFAMGPPEAPRTVSVGLRNCYLALPKRHKLFLYWASKLLSGTFSAPSKTLKTLPAAFDGLRLLCHGTSQAPQAVSIGLRNCYLARCSFRRPFAALPWDIRGRRATSCFCWASKLLSGTFSAPLKTLKIPNTLNPGSSFRRAFDGLSSTTSDNIK